MSTLLVIAPGKGIMHDCLFNLLVAERGEHLASHICSNSGFAYGDLYKNLPERISEFKERFGEVEVKYINETNITEEELLFRNHSFYGINNLDVGKEIPI